MLRHAFLCSAITLSLAVMTVGVATPAAKAESVAKAPASFTLDQLLGGFGKMKGLQAQFIEHKHMKLLVKPLVAKGTLYFTPPGYLARHVVSPKPAKLLITPKHLEVRQDGQKQFIDLSGRKDVKLFVESFARLLAGDKAALNSIYKLTYVPAAASSTAGSTTTGPTVWTLTLTPKSATLSKLIKRLTITGRQYAVKSIRVDETSGDWSITTITKADPKRVFSAAERKQIFGLLAE